MSARGFRGMAGVAVALYLCLVGGAPATAQGESDVAVAPLIRALDDVASGPTPPPGMAVVMVRDGAPTVIRTWGELRLGSGAALEADTPIYIASLTKAFTGLLAAELDRRDVLPLDAALTDIWPELASVQAYDARAVTLRDLLSHHGAIRSQTLGFRTAYVGSVDWADYPDLLARHAGPRDAGFRYDNLGYLIYSAALHRRTGRDWRDWMDEVVLRPAALSGAASRASTYAAERIAWSHVWTGEAFAPLAPKADDVMHAAGGLFLTPRDAALWLGLQLGLPGPDGAPLQAAVEATHRPAVSYASADPNNPCAAYGLGWHLCRVGDGRVAYHAGGYTGATAWAALSLDRRAGLMIMITSDVASDWLADTLISQFSEAMAGQPFSTPPEAVARLYAERFALQTAERRDAHARDLARPQWGGWTWSPSAADLEALVGDYANDRLGRARLSLQDGRPVFVLGEYRLRLRPAVTDLFAGAAAPLDAMQPVRVVRDAGGVAVALSFGDDRFERVD